MHFKSTFTFFVNVLWLVVLLSGEHVEVLTTAHSKRAQQQHT